MRLGVVYVKVLLVTCPACKGTFPRCPSPQLTPTLWFLLHCNQTWHRLLSGEVVSFPEDNGQVEKRVSIFKLDRSWGSQLTGMGWVGVRRRCEQITTQSLCCLPAAYHPSSIILPAEQVADRLPLELAQASLEIRL